jgi:hypothetical protein
MTPDPSFTFTVTVLAAEGYTDAVRQLKQWKGGELNEADNIVVSAPVMGDVLLFDDVQIGD